MFGDDRILEFEFPPSDEASHVRGLFLAGDCHHSGMSFFPVIVPRALFAETRAVIVARLGQAPFDVAYGGWALAHNGSNGSEFRPGNVGRISLSLTSCPHVGRTISHSS